MIAQRGARPGAAPAAASARAPQSVFPLMAPAAPDFSAYEGFATVRGPPWEPPRQFPLRVDGLPPRALRPAAAAAAAGAPATLRGARLRLGAELRELLGTYEAVLQARLEGAPDLASFFEELRDAVSRALTAAPPRPAPRAAAAYLALLDHLAALPEGAVAGLSGDAAAASLVARDRRGRAHRVEVAFPTDYPRTAPAVSADLPVPFELPPGLWDPSGGSSLADLLAAVAAAADSHDWLWAQLEELDASAYVIEPSERPPPRAAAARTVALGGHVTLLVALDPRAGPAQPPRVQLLGAEAAVAPRRAALAAALQGWRADSRLLETLQRALGALPGPPGAAAGGHPGEEAADVQAECVICYSYRFPGEARAWDPPADVMRGPDEGRPPEVPCENPKCGRHYHRTCLAEWLRGSANTTKVFNTLFGACAFCESPISVVVPT